MGHAVRLAAEDARAKLAALANDLGLPAGSNVPPSEIFRRKYGMQAGTIVGSGSFVPEYASPDHDTGLTTKATPYWMPGGAGAEIEIDIETGQLRVTRLINVADAGTPINPRLVETQLSGGAIMQLGFTLTEEMLFRDGQLINPSLADYKIPGFRDLPLVIENEAVASSERGGPFGAKGVGESATFGVSPAIANAIDDAIGVRLTSLPLKPEAILRALRVRDGRPLPEE
jgi:CO/xanthine dehydrogenase Mo-binding subunit